MDFLQALILGLVEGITEYLPVSSTGHLLIAQRLLGIPPSEAANAFAIAIQAGAILAVLGIYRQRAGQMLQGLVGRNADGLRLVVCLIAAFLPAAVLGVLFDDAIERVLFGVWPILIAWVVGGIAILLLSGWVESGAPAAPSPILRTRRRSSSACSSAWRCGPARAAASSRSWVGCWWGCRCRPRWSSHSCSA